MTTVKNGPNQPIMDPNDTWDWEENTIVDRHNRFDYRLLRYFRTWWVWALVIGIIVAALFDPGVMTVIMSLGSLALRLLFLASFIIFQFVVFFWFGARTRMYEVMPGAEGVGFEDYRGQPELLEQARQIVQLLRGVRAFEGAGGEPLNGLLLEGPPGTGKTWLAQAISTEAGVPFYYVDTSSLSGMFMGISSIKAQRIYGKARKKAKEYGASVMFLDEIDAIGSRGGVSQVGGQQGMGSMGGDLGLLSTILIEMSGFSLEHGWRARLKTTLYRTFLRRNPPKPQKRVLTIGATNRMDALDPALLRPGRFDKKLHIDVPDMTGRRDIFDYYLNEVSGRGMSHDDTMDPAVLATETPGYTPAAIKYVLNETLRYALFAGRRYMTYADFVRAQPEHEMGLRAPLRHMSEEARERLAFHEAGHAVAVRLFLPHHRISRITVVRQGGALGHVWHYSAREYFEYLDTKEEYLNRLRVSAAGKAAEIEFCGIEYQTLGAIGDIVKIANALGGMSWSGMFGPLGGGMFWTGSFSDAQLEAIDEMYKKIVQESRAALREHGHIVRALVALLIEKEELMADDVRAFFDQYGLYTPEPTTVRDGEEIRLLSKAQEEEVVAEAATPAKNKDV